MKSDVMGTGTLINKNDLKELVKESKEMNADAQNDSNNRGITVAEFWNVQKRQRTTASMMRRWTN